MGKQPPLEAGTDQTTCRAGGGWWAAGPGCGKAASPDSKLPCGFNLRRFGEAGNGFAGPGGSAGEETWRPMAAITTCEGGSIL